MSPDPNTNSIMVVPWDERPDTVSLGTDDWDGRPQGEALAVQDVVSGRLARPTLFVKCSVAFEAGCPGMLFGLGAPAVLGGQSARRAVSWPVGDG